MTDIEAFYDAAVPEPFTVLGLRLRPLSMGHLIILHRIGSPFVTESESVTAFGDLAVACLICSKTFEEGCELIADSETEGILYRWGKWLTRRHWGIGKRRRIDVKKRMEFFGKYIEQYSHIPGHYWKQDGESTIGAPVVQTVKVQLLMRTNLSESEILNRSWLMCLWDMLTIRALEGQLRFVEQSKISDAQKMANELAAKLNKRSGGNGN